MEKIRFGGTDLMVSPVVLGTWVTGGWAWGGSDDKESILAILRGLELGINFIDTAPVYGFGRSERLIGKALGEWGRRESVVIATKCGLEWDDKQQNIQRNASAERILKEADDCLERLGLDTIDLFQVHWPDPKVPFEETMGALLKLQEAGKVRYIGLSNFAPDQVEQCLATAKVSSLQPPFNLFEREAEKEILPFCVEKGIATLTYGGLCRGLLTGKFTGSEQFAKGDIRRVDPKFKSDRLRTYVKAVDAFKKIASTYGKSPAQFALRWALQQPGVTTVIAGARNATQIEDNVGISGWEISAEDLQKVEEILAKHIKNPVGPGFMAPN